MGKWRDSGDLTARQMLDLPPVWLVAGIALVWVQTVLLPGWTHPFALTGLLGAVLVLAGVALMIWAIAAFRAHQTSVVPHQVPRQLITTGPFAYSRNPIYLGDVLVLAGAVLWWGAWPSLPVIPTFVWIIQRRFVSPEERCMQENFGQQFTDFVQKTPRWL